MEFARKVKAIQFKLSRSLLFFWVKPTVLGISQLTFNDSDSVCYVLPFRSTADLLVTDKICERAGLPRPTSGIRHLPEKRAVFFIGHPEGFIGRRTRRQQSERMKNLFTYLANANNNDIKIVPVSIFWGHQPDRQKSFYKLILSENWTVSSRFKKLLAMIFHPNHTLVQVSSPVSLTQLVSTESNREKQIRKLLRILRVHFKNQRQAIIGPDLSHRRTLINTILTSNTVREAITRESKKTGEEIRIIEEKAQSHAREIASQQSYRVIRLFHILLTWLWNKLYDGIDVNNEEQVKLLARSHEIIYTPSHRSHIDYLLLSYVLYHNGLTPPHIAAGINLKMPVVGGLLRRAGAFFMHRSFSGDALYQAVFDEYLHQMFIKGYSVEYFIEGGRSRTGRTLHPKTGLLSMTISSFLRNSRRPVCLMPVYFGYERVLEVSTYMGELSGKHKKKESLLDIIGVIRSFRYSFGRVTVNFGAPVILGTFLDEHLPDWQTTADIDNRKISNSCRQLAELLITRINSSVAINAVSLTATALLSSPRQTMEESQLLRQIEILKLVATDSQFSTHMTITDLSTTEILDHAIKVTGITRQKHAIGTIISTEPELAAMLTYYRNNVVNVFAIPSLIARYGRDQVSTSIQDIQSFVRSLYPYICGEFILPWQAQEMNTVCEQTLALLARHGLIECSAEEISIPEPTSSAYAELTCLSEIMEPTLERFYIVTELLQSGAARTLRKLESDASAIAQKLSIIYGINSPTFFERSLFGNFIDELRANNLIHIENNGFKIAEEFSTLSNMIARTLDADIRYNILQASNQHAPAVAE